MQQRVWNNVIDKSSNYKHKHHLNREKLKCSLRRGTMVTIRTWSWYYALIHSFPHTYVIDLFCNCRLSFITYYAGCWESNSEQLIAIFFEELTVILDVNPTSHILNTNCPFLKKFYCHWSDHIMSWEIYDKQSIIGLWRYSNQGGVVLA